MRDSRFSLTDVQMLQSKLKVKEELPTVYAAILAEEAMYRFDERVQAGVRLWMRDELSDDFTVEEISMADIREELGLTGFAALGFLDVYLKRQDVAEYELKWFDVKMGGGFDLKDVDLKDLDLGGEL